MATGRLSGRRRLSLSERAAATLAWIGERGVVLQSARGPVPNVAQYIAGEPIRGSWWGHPAGKEIYAVLTRPRRVARPGVDTTHQRKVTLLHRRVWPSVVRVSELLGVANLSAIHSEHTASGAHHSFEVEFPLWVPEAALRDADVLSLDEAFALLPKCLQRARTWSVTPMSAKRDGRGRLDQVLTPQTFLLYAVILADALLMDFDRASKPAICALRQLLVVEVHLRQVPVEGVDVLEDRLVTALQGRRGDTQDDVLLVLQVLVRQLHRGHRGARRLEGLGRGVLLLVVGREELAVGRRVRGAQMAAREGRRRVRDERGRETVRRRATRRRRTRSPRRRSVRE